MPPTFADILRMPEDEREKLGKRVLTTRWWDSEEIRALTKQTWFSKLRRDLNESGRVTLDLGVFKYEQGGTAHDLAEIEVAKTVTQLFEKTPPASREELGLAQKKTLASTVFQPQFVMLEGELLAQLADRKYLELMLTHIGDFFGIDARPRTETRVIDKQKVAVCQVKIRELFDMTGGGDEILQHWLGNSDNLKRERYRGREMASLALDTQGDRTKCTPVLCPLEAVGAFTHPGGFGARVLGWLEHGSGPQLFVRAIAIAGVFHFRDAPV